MNYFLVIIHRALRQCRTQSRRRGQLAPPSSPCESCTYGPVSKRRWRLQAELSNLSTWNKPTTAAVCIVRGHEFRLIEAWLLHTEINFGGLQSEANSNSNVLLTTFLCSHTWTETDQWRHYTWPCCRLHYVAFPRQQIQRAGRGRLTGS